MQSQNQDEESITGINVTPLVDIALVLLIIFMVTTTLIVNPSIKVELPKSKTTDPQQDQRVNVTISKDLDYYIAGVKTEQNVILDNVRQKFVGGNTNLQVIITADKVVAIEHVIKFMDGVKRTGVTKIGIQVEKAE